MEDLDESGTLDEVPGEMGWRLEKELRVAPSLKEVVNHNTIFASLLADPIGKNLKFASYPRAA